MMRLATLLLFLAMPAMALEFSLPNASSVRTDTDPAGRIRLPQAPWSPDVPAATQEGEIRREVLRVPTATMTTLQLLSGMREALSEAGYDEVFACANAACGGFDFRFQLDILGEPDMHVDLGNFLYVVVKAAAEGQEPHTVALLASRSRTAGFVHITTVSTPGTPPEIPPEEIDEATPTQSIATTVPDEDLTASLVGDGHAVLPDLDFGTGSATLGPGPYASLASLARWLAENPGARIVLVGHTDSVGSLEANTALSLRRASAVSERLQTQYGVAAIQLQAAGAGYLAPRASNLTDDGRALNRRVEVVLLSVE